MSCWSLRFLHRSTRAVARGLNKQSFYHLAVEKFMLLRIPSASWRCEFKVRLTTVWFTIYQQPSAIIYTMRLPRICPQPNGIPPGTVTLVAVAPTSRRWKRLIHSVSVSPRWMGERICAGVFGVSCRRTIHWWITFDHCLRLWCYWFLLYHLQTG